jgi:RHS repeat-associated protein
MSYDPWGMMKVLRRADFDGDGEVTLADYSAFDAAYQNLEPSADFSGDGVVDGTDSEMFMEALIAEFFGAPPDEVRISYAAYVRDPLMEILLARHRWYDSRAGRWLTRDPAGYVDGLSLYLFVKGNPLGLVDPTGLLTQGVLNWVNKMATGMAQSDSAVVRVAGYTASTGASMVTGAKEGAVNIAIGAGRAAAEVGKMAFDVGGVAVEVTGAVSGTFDYRHEYASSAMKTYGHGGSWGEVLSDGLELGPRMALSAGTAGAADIVQGVYYGITTGDYDGASQQMGEVALGNLSGSKSLPRQLVKPNQVNVSMGPGGFGMPGGAPNLPPGSFSIIDWRGYPSHPQVPKPQGPFRLIEGAEYKNAVDLKEATNRRFHSENPQLTGLDIHEVHPVKFGGSPTDLGNKTALPPVQHRPFTSWWNRLQRRLTE